MFLVGDACGDIHGDGEGLFRDDIRRIPSCLRLSIVGKPLVLLEGRWASALVEVQGYVRAALSARAVCVP